MPKITIPLARTTTARGPAYTIGSSGKDEQLINAFVESASNSSLESKSLFVTKRQGSANSTSIGTTPRVLRNCGALGPLFIAGSGQNLYNSSATSLGVIGGFPQSGSACGGIVGTKNVIAFPAASSGWYLWDDAISTNFPTFTGNRTAGSPVISGIADTTGIYSGQAVTGTGIPASTRVLTVDSATQITLNANATSGAGTGTTITKEAVAKILSANFPDGFCAFMEYIDGFFLADHQSSAKIFNSKRNDPATWAAADSITLDYGAQLNRPIAISIFRNGITIVVGCNDSTVQHFRIGQNTTGTILSRVLELNKSGMVLQSLYPAQIGGSLYLLAASGSSSGDKALYRISGNDWQKISDNNWTAVFSSLGASVLGPMENGFKTLAFIGNQTAVNGVAFDPTNGQFGVISTPTAVLSTEMLNFTRASLSNFVQWSSSTGGLWTDSTAAFSMVIQIQPQVINAGHGFTVNSASLLADNQSSGSSTFETSADGGATWVTRGSFSLTENQKEIHRCGFYKNSCSLRITDSGNNPWRGEAIILDVEPAVT